eukprot:5196973-Pyramimonas_sp.AAC.1
MGIVSRALDTFTEQVNEAINQEKSLTKSVSTAACKEWVRQAMGQGTGRAHRWNKIKEFWRPVDTGGDTRQSTKPIKLLEREGHRLEKPSPKNPPNP